MEVVTMLQWPLQCNSYNYRHNLRASVLPFRVRTWRWKQATELQVNRINTIHFYRQTNTHRQTNIQRHRL